jgi:NTE family protein
VSKRRINIALQGGGAHGAFTWGALDRLLEEEDVEIAGISGTSAGALNGAALKAGLLSNGRSGAKAALDRIWTAVGAQNDKRLDYWMHGLSPHSVARALEFSPAFFFADALTRTISPYSYGPFYQNPLRALVEEFDFDAVCSQDGPKLFIGATRVRTGKIRVFEGDDICVDAILASACLPTLFQAIEIDDPDTGRREAYWDGGYTGNPALFPLFNKGLPGDVVIVNINPLERDAIPITPQEIQNRVNEISFNSSLFRELRAINFVNRLQDDGTLASGRMTRVRIHMIADDALMNDLSVATKLVPNAYILKTLKEAGRNAAHEFLSHHKDDLGKRATVDLETMFS